MTEPDKASAPKKKWYFKKGTLVFALLMVGPFALPLLWVNPRYSLFAKIFWSVLIIGITVGAGFFTAKLLETLMQQLSQMTSIYKI